MSFDNFKDIIVIFTPIIVAIISYKQNKKTKGDMADELKHKLEEMQAQTEQQKQIISWNGSMPQTNKYMEGVGVMRQGSLASLIPQINLQKRYIQDNKNITKEELVEIKNILLMIKDIPSNEEKLYPYEIEILLEYKRFLRYLDKLIEEKL